MIVRGHLLVLPVLLCLFSVSLQCTSAGHRWLPLDTAHRQMADPSQRSMRRLLYSVRMKIKGGRGGASSGGGALQAANCDRNPIGERSGSGWDRRLPIFVIGLKHREEERLAKFLLKLRWYEDLHVVEAVDGRTLDPTEKMTSGEVRQLHFNIVLIDETYPRDMPEIWRRSRRCCLISTWWIESSP